MEVRMRLVNLTLPNGQSIVVNAEQIVSFRDALESERGEADASTHLQTLAGSQLIRESMAVVWEKLIGVER